MQRFEIVKRIICEKENSKIIPLNARNAFQRTKLNRIYELLALLRILLALNIQTGWIHQDEFTNSLEVIAGDFFNLQVFKPQSFNSTFPTRSIFFLHTTIYLPYIFTSHHLIQNEHPLVKESSPNPSSMILIPRLIFVFLSFIVDFILIKFCNLQSKRHFKYLKEQQRKEGTIEDDECKVTSSTGEEEDDDHQFDVDYSIRLVTLASSQILLTFTTRTHAACLNLIFYSLLVYLVSRAMYITDDYIPLLNKYHQLDCRQDPIAKVKANRELKAIGYSSIQYLHWITLLIVAGLFNDPDFFLSYAFVPLFFYLQRGISNRRIGMTHFHARIFTFLAYFFTFSIPFILLDSFYYGKVCYDDFYNLNLSEQSFVFTPVNYFVTKARYLRDFTTLAQVLLQYAFLFNVLGLMGLTSFLKECYDICSKDWKDKPKLDSQWIFLNCSWFIPLIFLIQYKSPFDLIPLIFPLVYMHGHKIPLVSRFSSKIGLCWFACNLLGLVYWGYLSQGGVVTSFLDLYSNLWPSRYNNTHVDIILSQISPIPPTFVLALPLTWKTFMDSTKKQGHHSHSLSSSSSRVSTNFWTVEEEEDEEKDFKLPKIVLKMESTAKVRVLHTGNVPATQLNRCEQELVRLIQSKPAGKFSRNNKVNFLLLPSKYQRDVKTQFKNLRMTRIKTYWNHLVLDWDWSSWATAESTTAGAAADKKNSTSKKGKSSDKQTVPKGKSSGRGTKHAKAEAVGTGSGTGHGKVSHSHSYFPEISVGLDLYYFEPANQVPSSGNNATDKLVKTLYNWDEEEESKSWFYYLIQCGLFLLTLFLFVMSYVTFLL